MALWSSPRTKFYQIVFEIIKIIVFWNVHGLPFCFKIVHWSSGWVKLLMVTANSMLYLMKVRPLLWSHPRTKGQTNMKGSVIKLKTGSFQEYSSKQKNYRTDWSWLLVLQWVTNAGLGWFSKARMPTVSRSCRGHVHQMGAQPCSVLNF